MFRSNPIRSALVVALLAAASLGAHAAPVTITTPFINFENDAINSLGFSTGQFLRIGASVTPNGNGVGGTTGVAALSGTSFQTNINFLPSPAGPNFFSRDLSVTPQQVAGSAIFNPWTLTFTNSANGTTDSSHAIVQMQSGTQMTPFVNSITLSGTSANPPSAGPRRPVLPLTVIASTFMTSR